MDIPGIRAMEALRYWNNIEESLNRLGPTESAVVAAKLITIALHIKEDGDYPTAKVLADFAAWIVKYS